MAKKISKRIEIQKRKNLREIRAAIQKLQEMKKDVPEKKQLEIEVVALDDVFEQDNHGVRDDWDYVKELIAEIGPDIDKVLQDKNASAGVRARNKLSKIRDLCVRIRQGIQYQKEDNKSEY